MKTPRFWQSKNITSTALLPAEQLYRLGAWLDKHCTTPQHAPLPVISVGNVTAGGAGKTPATLALVPLLRALGHTPHILTRGYRGSSRTAHRVTASDDWQQVGDEALLLAAAAPTWVGPARLASAQAAAQAGASVLLCDDALQHHALYKDISLLVVDGPYGIGNGRLLPAGPLREVLAEAASRCEAAIIVGEDVQNLAARLTIPVFHATLQPAMDTPFLQQQKWLAFAGIGRPEKFFTTLRGLGASLVATRAFADHHAYTTADLTTLREAAKAHGAQLITTAKDAVKIPDHLRGAITTLPVDLTFENSAALQQFLSAKLPA